MDRDRPTRDESLPIPAARLRVARSSCPPPHRVARVSGVTRGGRTFSAGAWWSRFPLREPTTSDARSRRLSPRPVPRLHRNSVRRHAAFSSIAGAVGNDLHPRHRERVPCFFFPDGAWIALFVKETYRGSRERGHARNSRAGAAIERGNLGRGRLHPLRRGPERAQENLRERRTSGIQPMDVPKRDGLPGSQFLPGGSAVTFTLGQYSGGERIAVGSLESGKVRTLTEGRRPWLSPTGHLLFLRDEPICVAGSIRIGSSSQARRSRPLLSCSTSFQVL